MLALCSLLHAYVVYMFNGNEEKMNLKWLILILKQASVI